jgi:acyl-CoA thioesterase II
MNGTDLIAELLITSATKIDQQGKSVAHRTLSLGPPNRKHLSGGSTLAIAIGVLEKATHRPLVQAHAQFVAAPPCGSEFHVRIDTLRPGKSIAVARCTVFTEHGDAAYVSASLGQRDDLGTFSWAMMPEVPAPDVCPPVPFIRKDPDDLHSHLDIRLALDPRHDPKGHVCFWVKTPSNSNLTTAFVALIADYLPESIHMNTGQPFGASSLDNMVRIISLTHCDWLLCNIHLDAIASGLFHGHMEIFADDGALVAVASQSGVVQKLSA